MSEGRRGLPTRSFLVGSWIENRTFPQKELTLRPIQCRARGGQGRIRTLFAPVFLRDLPGLYRFQRCALKGEIPGPSRFELVPLPRRRRTSDRYLSPQDLEIDFDI